MLTSMVCRWEHFRSDWFARWSAIFGIPPLDDFAAIGSHRKQWEWCAIAQALEERGLLQHGKIGLGFAVGQEPLPSAFGERGARIIATDQPTDDGPNAWSASGQHARSLDPLFKDQLISRQQFDDRVSFQPVDMNRLAELDQDKYDFVWSSCSLEHLGSIEAGINFIETSMRILAPGGIAVHTTEYNVSSNAETLTEGSNVIYRRRDIEALGERLRALSAVLLRPDFEAGEEAPDVEFDYEPFFSHGRYHIKLLLSGFVATSMLLIVQRHRSPSRPLGEVLRTI